MLRDEIFGLGSCIAKYIVFVFNVIFAVSTIYNETEKKTKAHKFKINLWNIADRCWSCCRRHSNSHENQ